MARQFSNTLESPVVQTRAGKLRGFLLDGIYTFHGIPYADADRFQPPHAVDSWDGVKDATNYGYICPVHANPAPSSELFIPHRFWPANEHCQFLNVWTPGLDGRKRPVMVWFHGGGFSDGSSIEQVAYEGDALAAYGDVVVVTVNHRLNILGFLDMSSFGEKYANSVNAGMADIVASLEWVRDNIAAFGGDPGNVTIFGQSGGGGKVKTLMNIPAAQGLFHRAIMMSGGCRQDRATNADHRQLIEKMLEILEIPLDRVEELETVPYEILNRAFFRASEGQGMPNMRWGPVANDWFLGDPFKVGFSEYAKTVPTMVGTVLAEFTAMAKPEQYAATPEEQERIVRAHFGDASDSLIAQFREVYPGKALINLDRLDTTTRQGAARFVELKAAASSAPTYQYLFALNFDIMDGVPAWHCADIPFVFHNCDRVACCNIPGVTERLQDEIAGAWVSFAYSGDPNHAGMAKWEPAGENHETMVFDRKSQCRSNHDLPLLRKMDEACPPKSLDEILMGGKKDGKQEKSWMY